MATAIRRLAEVQGRTARWRGGDGDGEVERNGRTEKFTGLLEGLNRHHSVHRREGGVRQGGFRVTMGSGYRLWHTIPLKGGGRGAQKRSSTPPTQTKNHLPSPSPDLGANPNPSTTAAEPDQYGVLLSPAVWFFVR